MYLEANLPLERVPSWYSVDTELKYNAVFGCKYYKDNDITTSPTMEMPRSFTANTTYLDVNVSTAPMYVLYSVFLRKIMYSTEGGGAPKLMIV